jgi:hypothetical protein
MILVGDKICTALTKKLTVLALSGGMFKDGNAGGTGEGPLIAATPPCGNNFMLLRT